MAEDKENVIPASKREGYAIINAMDEFVVKFMEVEGQFIPLYNYRKDTCKHSFEKTWNRKDVSFNFFSLHEAHEKLREQLNAAKKWFLSIGSADAGHDAIKVVLTMADQMYCHLFPVMELNDSLTTKKRILIILQHKDDFVRESKEVLSIFLELTDCFRKFVKHNKWQSDGLFDIKVKTTELSPEQTLVDSLITYGVMSQDAKNSKKTPLPALKASAFAYKILLALQDSKSWMWTVFGPEDGEKIKSRIYDTIAEMEYHLMSWFFEHSKDKKLKLPQAMAQKLHKIQPQVPRPEECLQNLHDIVKQLQMTMKKIGPAETGRGNEAINKPNSKARKIFGDEFGIWGLSINYKNLWHKIKNLACIAKKIKAIRNFIECKLKKS